MRCDPRFGNGTFLYHFDWYRGIYAAIIIDHTNSTPVIQVSFKEIPVSPCRGPTEQYDGVFYPPLWGTVGLNVEVPATYYVAANKV